VTTIEWGGARRPLERLKSDQFLSSLPVILVEEIC